MSLPDQGLKLSERGDGAGLLIEAYGDGGFRIAGERIEGAILIVDDQAFGLEAMRLGDLSPVMLAPVFTAEPVPDIVLIGWGMDVARPAAAIRDAFARHGLAFDTMDSGAAARTYNVLRMEDRRVAAVLMPVTASPR